MRVSAQGGRSIGALKAFFEALPGRTGQIYVIAPSMTIEVDDLDAAPERVRAAGIAVEYGPAQEPWGVRRFYVRDPLGKLVNVLAHC